MTLLLKLSTIDINQNRNLKVKLSKEAWLKLRAENACYLETMSNLISGF